MEVYHDNLRKYGTLFFSFIKIRKKYLHVLIKNIFCSKFTRICKFNLKFSRRIEHKISYNIIFNLDLSFVLPITFLIEAVL